MDHFSLSDVMQNLSNLASEHRKDTTSVVGSSPSSVVSMGSVMSDMSQNQDATREKALDNIEKAQSKSSEQRIRSFCNAAAMGDKDMIQRLIKAGTEINGTDCDGRYDEKAMHDRDTPPVPRELAAHCCRVAGQDAPHAGKLRGQPRAGQAADAAWRGSQHDGQVRRVSPPGRHAAGHPGPPRHHELPRAQRRR
jgi:hypothetical protein